LKKVSSAEAQDEVPAGAKHVSAIEANLSCAGVTGTTFPSR
jgi:hypothetical protein